MAAKSASGQSPDRFNRTVLAVLRLPVIGGLARRGVVPITYVGRRSGRTITLPVVYRRDGDTVTIGVARAESKTWWRTFLGDGAPIRIGLDSERTGHAVARRDEKGRTTVVVQLDPL
ncbi:hypothetical protein [Rhodococcus sp. NPDC047139]|uniref:hypothetical protein n=1 Tax=Rhodococcus sp. NPDC047139 TaxID=3155141 RepID=UPI0033F1B26D